MMTLSSEDRSQLFKDTAVQFWKHIIPIVYFALAIHVVLVVLFFLLDLKILWIANVFSTLIYINCLYLIRGSRYRQAGQLMSAEIIAHAVLASWVIGWESNFSLYMFCVIPIIAFTFQLATFRRIAFSLAIMLAVVGCFALRRQMGLESVLSNGVLDAFGIVNALAATSLSIYSTALSVRFASSMQMTLFQLANRDSLTNLYTRRRIQHRVRQMESQCHGLSAALILLDIDHFKKINDVHGHETGDLILQNVSKMISSSVRAADMAARWGGEEFLVLMPDTSLAVAVQVAERISQRIRDDAGQIPGQKLEVTATLAVTQIGSDEGFQRALNRADALLYQGKEQGRNRVMGVALAAEAG